MLRAALQVRLDAGRLELRLELGDRPLDVAFAALASRVEELGELAEALRLEHLEREVLELPLHLPDAEPFGERRVDLHGLASDADLLLRGQRVERPHVVQPVRELDQDDPDVLGHREQHLADVLGLLLLVAVGAEARQLGDAVDELRDLRPEALLDVAERELGVLGDIVEERRLDRDRIDAELRDDLGRGDRVRDVRLAGGATLALVRLDREVERVRDRFEVGLRVVLRGGRQELLLEGVEIGARRLPFRLEWRGRPARAPLARGRLLWRFFCSDARCCHRSARIAAPLVRPARNEISCA